MMSNTWVYGVGLTAMACGAAWAQRQPEPRDGAVEVGAQLPRPGVAYVESSDGISTPGWEGGRTELELADLNGDGHLDVVSVGDHGSPFVNSNLHGISVWFGDGAGGWISSQTGEFGYGGVAIGDVNNDGLLDAAYGIHHNYSGVDLGDQLLEVALGDGTGVNWTPWDDGLATHGQSWGMFGTELADIDADGWLDVASVGFGALDGFHVYRNNADGTWTRTMGFLGGNCNLEIQVGDVNNDGYPDFATSHASGTVRLNDGDGQFMVLDAGLPGSAGFGRTGPYLADMDGDGHDDISFASNGGVRVYRFDPDGPTWVNASADLPTNGPFQATQMADMNFDGDVDLVAFGDGRLVVWLGDGGRSWEFAATFTVPSPGDYSAMRVGDADHNGKPDIVLLSDQGSIFNSRNKLQFFTETSIPNRPAIRLYSPARSRVVRAGSATFVDWQAAVPDRRAATVSLELSTTGPDGPWTPLAQGLPNNGRHQLAFDAEATSADCHIRATMTLADQGEATAISGPFTILVD